MLCKQHLCTPFEPFKPNSTSDFMCSGIFWRILKTNQNVKVIKFCNFCRSECSIQVKTGIVVHILHRQTKNKVQLHIKKMLFSVGGFFTQKRKALINNKHQAQQQNYFKYWWIELSCKLSIHCLYLSTEGENFYSR